jgi:hypothetical protein
MIVIWSNDGYRKPKPNGQFFGGLILVRTRERRDGDFFGLDHHTVRNAPRPVGRESGDGWRHFYLEEKIEWYSLCHPLRGSSTSGRWFWLRLASFRLTDYGTCLRNDLCYR